MQGPYKITVNPTAKNGDQSRRSARTNLSPVPIRQPTCSSRGRERVLKRLVGKLATWCIPMCLSICRLSWTRFKLECKLWSSHILTSDIVRSQCLPTSMVGEQGTMEIPPSLNKKSMMKIIMFAKRKTLQTTLTFRVAKIPMFAQGMMAMYVENVEIYVISLIIKLDDQP